MPDGMLDKLANVYAMLTKDAQRSDAQVRERGGASARQRQPAIRRDRGCAARRRRARTPSPPVAVARRENARPNERRRQDALRLQLQSHDAARRRGARPRARAAGGADQSTRCCASASSRSLRQARRATSLVACTQEQRLLGDVAEEGGTRAGDPLRQHPRDGRLVGRGRPWRRRRSRRCSRWRRCPTPTRCRASRYQSDGQLLDHRSARRRAVLGRGAAASGCAVTVLATGRTSRRARLPAERAYPVYTGTLDRARRLARRVRRRVDAGESDRSRPVHALQRVPARVPRAGDRRELPDRPRPLQGPPRLRRRVRRRPGDRLRARGHHALRDASTSCSTCTTSRVVRAAPAAAGLFPPGRRRARAGQGRHRARHAHRRIREAEVLQLQGVAVRAQPLAQEGCTQCIDVCSALAIRPDGDRIAVEPHLCVGCGACTTVCPSGALTYAYPAVPDLAVRIKTLLGDVRARRRPRRVPAAARRGRPRRDRARRARRGAGTAGARDPARDSSHRVRRPRRLARVAGVGRLAGRRAGDRPRSAAVSRCARVPDARSPTPSRNALGYQGEHFRAGRRRCARRRLRNGRRRSGPRVAATFAATPEKRTTAGARDRASRRARADAASR